MSAINTLVKNPNGLTAIALGLAQGAKNNPMFGFQNAIGTNYEGIGQVFNTITGAYTFPTVAVVLTLASSEAADSMKVRVTGVDQNYNEVTEDITLNGTSDVTGNTKFLRVNKVEPVATTPAGKITIAHKVTSTVTTEVTYTSQSGLPVTMLAFDAEILAGSDSGSSEFTVYIFDDVMMIENSGSTTVPLQGEITGFLNYNDINETPHFDPVTIVINEASLAPFDVVEADWNTVVQNPPVGTVNEFSFQTQNLTSTSTVQSTTTTTLSEVTAGYGISQDIVYTVPAGHELLVYAVRFTSGTVANNKYITARGHLVQNGYDNIFWETTMQNGEVVYDLRVPYRIPEKTDFYIEAKSSSGENALAVMMDTVLVRKD